MSQIIVSGVTSSVTAVDASNTYLVESGGTLDILNGGLVSGLITVSQGGTLNVYAGGTDSVRRSAAAASSMTPARRATPRCRAAPRSCTAAQQIPRSPGGSAERERRGHGERVQKARKFAYRLQRPGADWKGGA